MDGTRPSRVEIDDMSVKSWIRGAAVGVAAVMVPLGVPAMAHASVYSDTTSAKTFYPHRIDGYRDTFKAWVYDDCGLGSAGATAVSAAIFNSSTGHVVQQISAGYAPAYDDYALTWNGRRHDGQFAPDAVYSLRVTDSNVDQSGAACGGTRTVTGIHPTTGYRYVKHTASRYGRYDTSHSSCANFSCVIDSSGYSLWMQSFDRGISATWHIGISTGAFNVSCGITTSYTDGPHSKSCSRIAPGTESVRVSLPTNAVVVVDKVLIAYTTKRRI